MCRTVCGLPFTSHPHRSPRLQGICGGVGCGLGVPPIFSEMMLRGPTSARPWVTEGGHKTDSVLQLTLRALDFKGLLVPRGHDTQVSELMAEVGPER